MYVTLVRGMAFLMILIGVSIVVRTLPHLGIGIVLGLLFVAAGVGRLYMLRRREP